MFLLATHRLTWISLIIIGMTLILLGAAAAETPSPADEQKMFQLYQQLIKKGATREACEFIAAELAKFGEPVIPLFIRSVQESYSFSAGQAASEQLVRFGVPAVPLLIQNMIIRNHSNSADSLARALGKIGAPAVQPLISLLKDPEQWFIPETYDEPHYVCQSDKPPEAKVFARGMAVTALGYVGRAAEPAIPALIEELRLGRDEYPDEYVKTLGLLGPAAKDAEPLLSELLREQTGDLKIDIAVALFKINPQNKLTIPALVSYIKHPFPQNPHTGSRAIYELMNELGPAAREATPAIIPALKSDDEFTASCAAEALSKIDAPPDLALPALLDAMRTSPHADTRLFAAQSVGRFGEKAKPVVPEMVKLLPQQEPKVQIMIAKVILMLAPPNPPALNTLVFLLKSEDAEIRENAVSALRELGLTAHDAIPAIIPLLSDQNETTGRIAAWALYTAGTPPETAVPLLVSALKNSPLAGVRNSAAWTLGLYGPAAQAAGPALQAALQDKDPDVREAAQKALGALDGKPMKED